MAKTLSMAAYNLSTPEAEQMDLWEFKASLINITNFKTARVHVSKTIQKARKSAARAEKAEEKTDETQLSNLLGWT